MNQPGFINPLTLYMYVCIYIYIYINVNVYVYILVGGFTPSEKYYLVSWDYYSQYMEKKCSKPPTSGPTIYPATAAQTSMDPQPSSVDIRIPKAGTSNLLEAQQIQQ